MSGVPRLPIPSLLAVLVLVAAPPPVPAAEDGIAAEPGTILLPGTTAGAVAIEGDGGSALVRLVEGSTGSLAAEAWVEDGDTWAQRGAAARLEGDGERARLITARIGGVPTAVAVTSPVRAFSCCTRVVAVRFGDAGARAEPVGELDLAIDAVIAADLDGDGSDELVLRGVAVSAAEIAPTIHVARIVDDGLDVVARLPLRSRLWETPFVLGDTDGLPGEEIGFLDHSGPGHLGRLTWRPASGASLETARLFAPRLPRQDVTGVRAMPDGTLLVVNTASSQLVVWASGSEPQLTRTGGDGGLALGILRDESAVRIVTLDLLSGGVRILDEQLRRVATIRAPGNVFGSAWLPQYTGPLPRPGGGSAVAAYGVAYRLEDGELRTDPAAGLGATHPIAVLGRDGRWLALLRTLDGRPMRPSGGQLRDRDDWVEDRLSVARSAITLSQQPELSPQAWLTMDGAAPGETASRDPGSMSLTVSADGYRLGVLAPPGSQLHMRGAPGGAVTIDVGDAPSWQELDVHPTSSDPILLAVVTPSGRSYTARVTVDRVLAAAPPLEVEAFTELLSASVRVDGRTLPGALVTVDGEPTTVDGDGRFVAQAAAAIVPRGVAVEAIDPLGGRSSAELLVVGFVDYLSLPWPALLAIGVLGAVAAFAWRRPPRVAHRPAAGSLQEIGADLHAQTIPNSNQTGAATPPISGWGEPLTGEERVSDDPEEEGRP